MCQAATWMECPAASSRSRCPRTSRRPLPRPPLPTVTEQVTPRAEVVEHSGIALESVRDEAFQLLEAELLGVAALRAHAAGDPSPGGAAEERERGQKERPCAFSRACPQQAARRPRPVIS